ncbi:hypothetical protein B7C51_20440 [Paenibacillus larvae subsp. pulvifaciens]|uniref:DUF7210 domain-containing protein n=1 Tax=Paenibacillus larvae subsp. pulvifaciens TaxID=1477 RepID=A0A1V0UWI5_9BACL|nr:hypothetical protein [Paenibacillus larvae]ARF66670.1 hypothetical protein B7C51_00910 [Paenibacillus larvae subsp. pulvifaciens]ARF67036.1 hypothetical protein B7C51_03255 [Paenibacillus larvae subsp. pulvifaciens]ARF69519.1 hypothetical protein B7C51_19395 [Paenibacillus larvae subsp. pulvifaciens]ARF69696.1 hypothetical protein B7C51_20440 [Paenibacillus larvae subsp. pulvifaciens]
MAKKPDQTEEREQEITAKEAEEQEVETDKKQSTAKKDVKVQWVTNVKYRGNIYYAGQRTDVRGDDYNTLVNEKVIRLDE